MKAKKFFPAALAAAAMLLLTACGAEQTVEEETASAGVAVETQLVEASQISMDSAVSGAVSAENESTVLVALTAKCLETYVDAGDTVEEGQALCRLELDSTLSSYNAAKLALSSAQRSYNDQSAVFNQQISAADEQIALLEKTLSDTQALFAIGAASQLEIDQLQLQLDQVRLSRQSAVAARNSTLDQLRTSIESTRSNVQQLESALQDVDDDGNVVAPVSGLLVSMNAVKDGYVSSAMPVAVINGSGGMEITVSVSETLIPKLEIGDEADVSVAATGQSFTAVIRSVERSASAYTKLYTVTLTVPTDVTGLLSGMFADVTFHTDRVDDAIVIPSEAILTKGETRYVFVVEDGTAKYVEVEIGMTGSGVTQITGGLSAGQTLVTVGQSYLSDGDPVRVVREG